MGYLKGDQVWCHTAVDMGDGGYAYTALGRVHSVDPLIVEWGGPIDGRDEGDNLVSFAGLDPERHLVNLDRVSSVEELGVEPDEEDDGLANWAWKLAVDAATKSIARRKRGPLW